MLSNPALALRPYEPADRAACAAIFAELPQWFGIAEAVENYLDGLAEQESVVALWQDEVIAFGAATPRTDAAAEIVVMAVHPDHHANGIGRAIVEWVEDWCRRSERRFLQVKTLAPERESPEYAQTRAFYLALGFRPLETFAELWDPSNPALQLVKRVIPLTAERLVDELELEPHPEGGYYRETWRAARELELPDYSGPRNAGTSILYLLPTGSRSTWHRVASDELWLWQGGDELTLNMRDAEPVVLGPTNPQALVPARTWQSATPVSGPHGYVLCGCVVVPGFDFADFELE